ncbi:hypothetical protein [Nitratidesulfovibrio liaohensis]|uniref:HEPN AbiU2-like domain-containing protein n=1 Tax=Nitratidesulfovibrio liaohensis TaxID=2604158 RepID=A0ABY9QXU4_9BACT|nr:hypothetical protein [Nitratidesulfovibrio liaohensis]WMW64355.1 hypothetical protein KPS_002366 [Nitratidesulfovibrio liaohensis]
MNEYATKCIQKINMDTREVVAVTKMAHTPLFDKDYISRYDNTFSAHGLEIIKYSLHNYGIIIITRLWDNDKDSLSIINANKFYRENAHKIILRRKSELFRIGHIDLTESDEPSRNLINQSLHKRAERDSMPIDGYVQAELEELSSLINNVHFKDMLHSITNFRDKLAHPVDISRKEKNALSKGKSIDTTKWGDLGKLVSHTTEVVRRLNLLHSDLATNLEEFGEIWARYSTAFWDSASADPK